MIKLLILLAPAALLLPPPAAETSAPVPVSGQKTEAAPAPGRGDPANLTDAANLTDTNAPPPQPSADAMRVLLGLERMNSSPVYRQVRIEQRVVIRISPRRSRVRQELLADLPQGEQPTQYREREIGRCIPVRSIAGVQAGSGSRLIFFLRDQRIIAANLEKACLARSYYSGFYVEPSADGMLCINRDQLQSRSGAQCELERIRQLVRVSS